MVLRCPGDIDEVNTLIKNLDADDIPWHACAPSQVAARYWDLITFANLGKIFRQIHRGETLHRTFGWKIDLTPSKKRSLDPRTRVIFIDEAYMCRVTQL